jgi:hypothetical protein
MAAATTVREVVSGPKAIKNAVFEQAAFALPGFDRFLLNAGGIQQKSSEKTAKQEMFYMDKP